MNKKQTSQQYQAVLIYGAGEQVGEVLVGENWRSLGRVIKEEAARVAPYTDKVLRAFITATDKRRWMCVRREDGKWGYWLQLSPAK